MKRTTCFLVCCFWWLNTFAQPTKISGKLLNCKGQLLQLLPATGYFKDSIPVNPDGSFSYVTNHIKAPFQANLTNGSGVNIPLFLAPGYDLVLNADVKDNQTARTTLTYKGVGAKCNGYWQELFAKYKRDTVNWNAKDPATYIAHQLLMANNIDGINKIFGPANHEPYAGYFRQSLLLTMKFDPLTQLIASYSYENNLPWAQIQQLVQQLGITALERELNLADNLSSSSFSAFVSSYPFYCGEFHAFPADSIREQQDNYILYLTSKLYSGKVYDYVANRNIVRRLQSAYKPEDFQALLPYIAKVSNKTLQLNLKEMMARSIKERAVLQAGALSPSFNLPDTSGNLYQLADFKGKVIYIDLWASWCGPCQEETPHLKKIYEQYKNNDHLQIISIATFDAKNRRRRYDIMKQDQMTWLQLEDTNDTFAKAYQGNFIPRFIIIDKQGRIVDSDAVRPSEPEKLMAILNSEINK